MKRKLMYWTLIVLFIGFTLAANGIAAEKMGRPYPFIWTILIIPIIFMMIMYPKWKIIIGFAVLLSILKYTVELSQSMPLEKDRLIEHGLSSLVNWSILLVVGYYRIEYYKLLKKVKELTLIDALTGMYNRRYLDLYMEKTIPLSLRTKSPLVFILLDLDHFKKINDQYGHQGGDEALKHIAAILKKTVRKSDAFVRYGGEEFAIILPNTHAGQGQRIAEKIREAVEESVCFYQKDMIRLSISIGVALYGGEKPANLVEKADKALYQAKENGRNQVVVFKEA